MKNTKNAPQQEQPAPKPAIKKLTPEQLLKLKGGSGTGIVIDDFVGF